MYRPQNLRIPGPTFVPQAVLAASARPLINHRGPEFAAFVRDSGKLFLVDSVSGAGCADLEIDEWGLDVCVTASQRAWGAPPGVSMITMGPRAWKAYEKSNLPKAYFDLGSYKASLEKAQTPATPAVTVFIALQESLRLMAEEGLEAIIRRHRDLARATRRGLQAVNLQLFADERYASPAVTAFRPPARVDARNLIRILRDDHDTIVAGGQGKMEGQLVRVAHLGFVTLQDIVSFFSALELTLRDLNQPVEPGVAISATLRAYAESTQQPSRPSARTASTSRPANDAVATRR